MDTVNKLAEQFKQFQEEFLQMKDRLDLIEQQQQEIAELKSALSAKDIEIQQLKQQLKNNTANTSTQASFSSIMDSQWAEAVKTNINSQQYQQKTNKTTQKNSKTQQKYKKKSLSSPTEGMLNWAYRGFSENTGPTGYQFIHFKCPSRTNQRTVRKRLAIIGISNRRILAVQFPTRGVVAILVHNAYAEEIITQLAKGKVTPHNFDPHHESVICDPAHDDLSPTKKAEMATKCYHTRLIKLCLRLQPSYLGSSIIKYFNSITDTDKFHIPDTVVQQYFKERELQSTQNTTDDTKNNTDDDLFTADFQDLEGDLDMSDKEAASQQTQQ